MKILRVFPKRNSHTPNDTLSVVGYPGLFIPKHDEVHISITFTWDCDFGKELYLNWKEVTAKPVLLGGCAYNSPANEFISGRYIKNGIVITSRGCPNKCGFCFVPKREGSIKEINIAEGNIIQDNNFLACSEKHKEKVFEMLKTQKGVSFKGGLEPRRVTAKVSESLRGLRIDELWLACDSKGAMKNYKKAIRILKKAGFKRHNLRCYCLIGDDIEENENRLKEIYREGAIPFAQLLQGEDRKEYPKIWKDFARSWSRPASINAIMKKDTPE